MINTKKSKILFQSTVVLCFFLTACEHSTSTIPPETPLDTVCEEPRPEMCTMDYRPVCALRDTGIRCVTTPCDSAEWKTYSNACSACSDKDVIGFVEGEC